jgi:hypothetical protein
LVTAIVVSIAAQAIEAKIGLSKYTRALEEVIGKVGMIAEETKESMQSLGRGHQTLVTSSNELFKANAEIEALVQRAQQIPTSMTTMAELPQNQRKTIETLLVWVAVTSFLARADAH